MIPEEMTRRDDTCLDIPTPSRAKADTPQTLDKDDILWGVYDSENKRTDGDTSSRQIP